MIFFSPLNPCMVKMVGACLWQGGAGGGGVETEAGSLLHFDIHIGTVMILKAAIKLTVRTQGVGGGEMPSSNAAGLHLLRPAGITQRRHLASTSLSPPPSLLCSSSLSLFLSLPFFLTYTYPE